MANDPGAASPAASKAPPGPSLLAERRLAGIFVHLLGVPTWFVGPGVVYLASEHEFTRSNARNAVNWQVFHALVLLAVLGAFGLAALADSALPGGIPAALDAGLIYGLGAGTYALGVVFLLNVLLSLVATASAIFGAAWTYPVAPDVVGWLGSTAGGRWWIPIAAYAVAAPVVFAQVIWLALGNDAPVWPLFALLLATVVGAPLVAAALYRDVLAVRETGSTWQPNRVLYVVAPFVVGVLTYLARASLHPSENPAGDAVYGFMVALWLASVVYLSRRHRNVEP